jgi:hypothetical protein
MKNKMHKGKICTMDLEYYRYHKNVTGFSATRFNYKNKAPWITKRISGKTRCNSMGNNLSFAPFHSFLYLLHSFMSFSLFLVKTVS